MEGKRPAGRADEAQLEGFHHAALRARDFEASVAFYRDGLGMKPTISWGQGDGRAVMLETDAAVGNFIQDWCYRNGMILRNNGPILVLAPSLVISPDEVEMVIDMMDRALCAAEQEFRLK